MDRRNDLHDFSGQLRRRRQSADVRRTWLPVESHSQSERVSYQVRFCYLNKETVSLRLYDAGGKQVLAERTYFELDRPLIFWESDALGYDVSNGQKIALPPTRLDRLRALMP
jgi:hypothetical protein